METAENFFAHTLDQIGDELVKADGKALWEVEQEFLESLMECISNDTLWSVRIVANDNGNATIEVIDPDKLNLQIMGLPDNDLDDDYYLGYDRRYSQVYEEGGDRFEMKRPNEDILWLHNNGLLKPEHEVADLGCGEGRDSLAMAGLGCKKVYAVDIAASALGKLEEDRAAQQLTNIEIIRQNLTNLECLKDESVDVAVNMGALHMIVLDEERAAHLQEVARILRPNGLFLVKHSREWLKGFRSVIWEKIQDILLVPGQKIPRRIWQADGQVKEVEMEVLPHRVAEPDALVKEVEAQGFELVQYVGGSAEGGFGKSFSLLLKKL